MSSAVKRRREEKRETAAEKRARIAIRDAAEQAREKKKKQKAVAPKGKTKRIAVVVSSSSSKESKQPVIHQHVTPSWLLSLKSKPPKPVYAMRVANHVTSAQLIRLGGRSFTDDFSFPLVVGRLKGFHSTAGFACVTLRQIRPSVCCHVYDTGRIIACGAPVEIDVLLGMYKVMDSLRRGFGWNLRLANFSVSNVVASMALGYYLDLCKLYDAHSDQCHYWPEDFPGLFFYPNGFDNRKPCIIIQSSGAVVVVGTKDVQQARRTASKLHWPDYRLLL